jgi:hypothetical protein
LRRLTFATLPAEATFTARATRCVASFTCSTGRRSAGAGSSGVRPSVAALVGATVPRLRRATARVSPGATTAAGRILTARRQKREGETERNRTRPGMCKHTHEVIENPMTRVVNPILPAQPVLRSNLGHRRPIGPRLLRSSRTIFAVGHRRRND